MRLSIEDFKLVMEFPTHWGNMDSARHINNLVYMRWAETARVAYFMEMGMNTDFKGDATSAILGWQDCKYTFPMTHPDTAIVGVRTKEVESGFILLETAIFSKQHQRIAAITKQRIVPYNYAKLSKVDLPASWIAGIRKIDGDHLGR